MSLVIVCVNCGERMDLDPDGERYCLNCDRWTVAQKSGAGSQTEAEAPAAGG
jgi:hypothetical protein